MTLGATQPRVINHENHRERFLDFHGQKMHLYDLLLAAERSLPVYTSL